MSGIRRYRYAILQKKKLKGRKKAEGREISSTDPDRLVGDMLHAVIGNVGDPVFLHNVTVGKRKTTNVEIDTIVNAAKPTLMGSNQGVDGAVHEAIDNILHKKGGFNEKIREELDGKPGGVLGGRVRCERGSAVMTKGYGLCRYVIHAVGTVFDCKSDLAKKLEICSSSRVRILESCYREIVRVIRAHPEIKNVAIPIIGSGRYGFPFEMAAKIAITGVGNALLEWQQEDGEYFNSMSESVQNIYFCVWDNNTNNRKNIKDKFRSLNSLLSRYRRILNRGKSVVSHYSPQSQMQYFTEIKKYDHDRGYFCIAKVIRVVLSFLRLSIFFVYTCLKDVLGGKDWQRRRFWVEMTVALKIGMAVLFGYLLVHCSQAATGAPGILLRFILCYNLADTITYLISLILMADIQKPSANVIRSMLLLLLNYVEVSIEIACLYLLHYGTGRMSFLQALQPGLMGELPEGFNLCSLGDYLLYYGNTAVKFFFITMAFGYLAGHLRQRTFRRQNMA